MKQESYHAWSGSPGQSHLPGCVGAFGPRVFLSGGWRGAFAATPPTTGLIKIEDSL